MGEREWWINVYPMAPEHRRVGVEHSSKDRADEVLERRRADVDEDEQAAFRIHVRLKPEGAPKRYASPHDRWCWENNPKRAAALDELFAMDLPFERSNEGGGDTA